MRIGIDTLFEHPEHGSSAVDYLENLVQMLPAAGPEHEYVVFVSRRNRARFERYAAPNVQFADCLVSNENVPLRIAVQQALEPLQARRHRVDVMFSPGNVCPLVGNFCRVLKINTLHHYILPQFIGRSRSVYRRIAFGASARRADHIVANTAQTKLEICEWMGVPERKVTVVWEASFSHYRPMPRPETGAACAKHGVTPGYLLSVSQLYPYKNNDNLIRAYAQLCRNGAMDAELVIIGRDSDGMLAKLQALAAAEGVADRVKFLGFVDLADLPYLYCGASVFCFPSLQETFGKPLVEAMQAGVPIVAANGSCIPEVVGNAGLLVDPLDPAQIAAGIHRVHADAGLRDELVARGLKRARLFTWENAALETMAVITRTYNEWKGVPRDNSARRASA